MGHIYHYGGVDDHYLSPYQTRANWLPWLLRKCRPFIFEYRPLPAPILQTMGLIYHCGCVDDHYLSPYQTRATWLPWLLRKSRPFVFLYGPLGPLTFICGAKMVIHFHSCIMPHTCVKFGPWAYFSFWSTRGGKEICNRPPGAPDLCFGGLNGSEFSSL